MQIPSSHGHQKQSQEAQIKINNPDSNSPAPLFVVNKADIVIEIERHCKRLSLQKAGLLILRPKFWGKSFNISILSHSYTLKRKKRNPSNVQDMILKSQSQLKDAISKDFMQYGVILLNLQVHGQDLRGSIQNKIKSFCSRLWNSEDELKLRKIHENLLKSIQEDLQKDLGSAIKSLFKMLSDHQKKKTVVIIDNYDSFLYTQTFKRKFKWQKQEQIDLLRSFLKAIVSSIEVHRTIIFGICSIFPSDDDAFIVSSLSDQSQFLKKSFGFTQVQVKQIIKKLFPDSLKQRKEQILNTLRLQYGGYKFRTSKNQVQLFHPKTLKLFLEKKYNFIKRGCLPIKSIKVQNQIDYNFCFFHSHFSKESLVEIKQFLQALLTQQRYKYTSELEFHQMLLNQNSEFEYFVHLLKQCNHIIEENGSFYIPNKSQQIYLQQVVLHTIQYELKRANKRNPSKFIFSKLSIFLIKLRQYFQKARQCVTQDTFNEAQFTSLLISCVLSHHLVPYSIELIYNNSRADCLFIDKDSQVLFLHQHKIAKLTNMKNYETLKAKKIQSALRQIFLRNYFQLALKSNVYKGKWKRLIIRGIVGLYFENQIFVEATEFEFSLNAAEHFSLLASIMSYPSTPIQEQKQLLQQTLTNLNMNSIMDYYKSYRL